MKLGKKYKVEDMPVGTIYRDLKGVMWKVLGRTNNITTVGARGQTFFMDIRDNPIEGRIISLPHFGSAQIEYLAKKKAPKDIKEQYKKKMGIDEVHENVVPHIYASWWLVQELGKVFLDNLGIYERFGNQIGWFEAAAIVYNSVSPVQKKGRARPGKGNP